MAIFDDADQSKRTSQGKSKQVSVTILLASTRTNQCDEVALKLFSFHLIIAVVDRERERERDTWRTPGYGRTDAYRTRAVQNPDAAAFEQHPKQSPRGKAGS